MAQSVLQASFNSGEWSPKLFARVDLVKYRSGAALLQNWFVDYRGGASTRPGTKYILQCFKSATAVRLIAFQAAFDIGYVLEFGDHYIRFFFNGAPILAAPTTITAASAGSPVVYTEVAHGHANGDWLFIQNNYYIVANVTANTFTLTDLFGNPINANPFTIPASARWVYTIASPYAAADLRKIKFAQNVSQMILTHPSYTPQVLTLIAANNWTIGNITLGSTIAPPAATFANSTLGVGSANYAYIVTAVDVNGQESTVSPIAQILSTLDIRSVAGTNLITWTAVAGAVTYNVYRANISYNVPVPAGVIYGFIGSSQGTAFNDSNIGPDFSETLPESRTPLTTYGNPGVCGFFQQRLVLGGSNNFPQTFYMSQTGSYFNFNVSQIIAPQDSITGTLVSGQLNTIRHMVPQTSGLLMFTDRNSWLINGGSPGLPVAPSALSANPQSFNGISDVPPIIANFDVLYVQAKGSIIRDAAYNIYANVFTGTDISAIASHLFFGYTVQEWAWAEEPFKVVWAIRSDGTMLTLTFLKEQEFIGWAHSTTLGTFNSVATVVENTATAGEVDAVYTVCGRTVQGQSLQYIERIAERTFPNGVVDAWTVDSGIQYSGAPATTFSGAQFLGGLTCTGLADGKVIPAFVMPTNGTFVLGTAASKVTVGLGFNCQLQTLPLEMGDPTVQGKVKKINDVDVLVADTLGLQIGSSFNTLVDVKDLVQGNISSMLVGQASQIVTDLVNGQARTILDPTYTVPGQYCIQQSLPLPATILGVIPNVTLGDGGQHRK